MEIDQDEWLTQVDQIGARGCEGSLLQPLKVQFNPTTNENLQGEADELLYDPCEDERNCEFIPVRGKDTQYSCAGCFSAVAYTTQSEESRLLNDPGNVRILKSYNFDHVLPAKDLIKASIKIDESKILEKKRVQTNHQQSQHQQYQQQQMQDSEENSFSADPTEMNSQSYDKEDDRFQMFFMMARCEECNEIVALVDVEQKTCWLKGVVPNYIG